MSARKCKHGHTITKDNPLSRDDSGRCRTCQRESASRSRSTPDDDAARREAAREGIWDLLTDPAGWYAEFYRQHPAGALAGGHVAHDAVNYLTPDEKAAEDEREDRRRQKRASDRASGVAA
jgi:hypothetical protein